MKAINSPTLAPGSKALRGVGDHVGHGPRRLARRRDHRGAVVADAAELGSVNVAPVVPTLQGQPAVFSPPSERVRHSSAKDGRLRGLGFQGDAQRQLETPAMLRPSIQMPTFFRICSGILTLSIWELSGVLYMHRDSRRNRMRDHAFQQKA